MKTQHRKVGVLLHISSLPNRYAIGTFGESAYRFVDALNENGIGYWQVLPLVQTGLGNSPYQSVYTASGNPYLIDLELLIRDGLLTLSECECCRNNSKTVDFSFVEREKFKLLRKAYSRFNRNDPSFEEFVRSGKFRMYSLFMVLKEKLNGADFTQWSDEYKFARPEALEALLRENETECDFWQFVQFEFAKQWKSLKEYANKRGVSVIGDIPLYVAADSVDVWQNPNLFKLKEDRTADKVAGVPPDYFSATGQLWGNPVYDWSAHRKDDFAWWKERVRQSFELYDIVRIDHFRGFDRYFEIDSAEKTAVNGVWKDGPGYALFEELEREFGHLNFIAEDLGTIDEGVIQLMEQTGFPGMKVLQFAFDGNPQNPYLPQNIPQNCICYTGTHDNDTLLGFVRNLKGKSRRLFLELLKKSLQEMHIQAKLWGEKSVVRALMMLAVRSRADLVIMPMQDILGEGSQARMNTPSTVGANWAYRMNCPVDENFSRLLHEWAQLSESEN